jgi:hypothetical protein
LKFQLASSHYLPQFTDSESYEEIDCFINETKTRERETPVKILGVALPHTEKACKTIYEALPHIDRSSETLCKTVCQALPLTCGSSETACKTVYEALPLTCGSSETTCKTVYEALPLICGSSETTCKTNNEALWHSDSSSEGDHYRPSRGSSSLANVGHLPEESPQLPARRPRADEKNALEDLPNDSEETKMKSSVASCMNNNPLQDDDNKFNGYSRLCDDVYQCDTRLTVNKQRR